MATYTTTQNGDWNDVNTWGGSAFPTNNDTATIVHTVTYNINDDVNTISTINLNTNGILQWTTSGQTQVLRFTNMSISGGKLKGISGTFLRCLGYIQVSNTDNSEISMIGSCPNFQTSLTQTVQSGSSYITVADSSGFGVGDYISIYDYVNLAWNDQSNECFVIQNIDGNDIYLKNYVGTKLTLNQNVEIGSNTFYCSTDVRSFIKGLKFIIDSEIFTVNSIDIYNNTIYTNENATSQHLSGVTGYESHTEKIHDSGEYVYKLAASIINASAGNNYIDVSSAGGWTTGDTIGIGGQSYAYCENRDITSIVSGGGSGGSDRIGFSSNLSYTHTDGVVIKLNRDCVFHGNTSDTISSTSGYIYVLANPANRTFRFENFEMRYYGNVNSVYYAGLMIRHSYNRSVIILNVSGRYAYKGGNNGFMGETSYYYQTHINSVIYDTYLGIGIYSSGSYNYFSGNIIMKTGSNAILDYGYLNNSFDYNISEGCAYMAYQIYYSDYTYFSEKNTYNILYNRRYNQISNYDSTSIYNYGGFGNFHFFKNFKVKNLITRLSYIEYLKNNCLSFLKNVLFESGNLYTSSAVSADGLRFNTHKLLGQITLYLDYNLIPGNYLMTYIYGCCEMDYNIKKSSDYSWKFTPKQNDSNYSIGFLSLIKGRIGRTIKIGGFLRKDSTTNSTVRLEIRDSLNNTVATSTLTTTNTWEWKTASYEITSDLDYIVCVGGYGSTGNFWVDKPTIYTDGCISEDGGLGNFWIKSDPTATGIRLKNGVKIK